MFKTGAVLLANTAAAPSSWPEPATGSLPSAPPPQALGSGVAENSAKAPDERNYSYEDIRISLVRSLASVTVDFTPHAGGAMVHRMAEQVA